MRKILIIVIVTFLFVSTIPIVASANTTIDYEAMGEHDGFAKAVYESYVTNSAYVASKYTDNLGYVEGVIGQIKENARFMWDEFKNDECTNDDDCNWGVEFYKKLLAGAVTAIDFIKGFFSDENEKMVILDYSRWDGMLIANGHYLYPAVGYEMVVIDNGGTNYIVTSNTVSGSLSLNSFEQYANLRVTSGNNLVRVKNLVMYNEASAFLNDTVSSYMTMISLFGGVTVYPRLKATGETPSASAHNENFNEINNYIQNNDNLVHPQFKPEIKTELVCPSITTNVDIVGADLKVNDKTLNVNKKTGATVYEGEDCVVNFTAIMPEITNDNKIVVSNEKDDTKRDVETNEKLDRDGKVIKEDEKDEFEGCDSVLCYLSGIGKVIGKIVTAIVELPLKIVGGLIEGLTDLFKLLFIPSEGAFSDFTDELNTTMTEKFNMPSLTSIFTQMSPNQDNNDLPPNEQVGFEDLKVSGLMGTTAEMKIIDSDSINKALPTIHSWIRGFFYVLLIFFNINHMYRLIRGTTIMNAWRGEE